MSAPPNLFARRLSALGPGVLFAGAAVGVSHLVQSTRAGAQMGLSLLLLVLLANVIKYPAFRFGPHYAAATGTSLLTGYRKRGRPALVLYAVLTLGTMFTVAAAVALVTAGLAKYVFSLPGSPLHIASGLAAVCAVMAALGGYRWLDRISKVVVAVFSLATIAATVLAIGKLPSEAVQLMPDFSAMTKPEVLFLAALIGWMPSAIDISAWQSIWTLNREGQRKGAPREKGVRLRDVTFDFHVGYISTALLAVCFLLLGASVMYGQELRAKPHEFAGQLIDLYTQTLGAGSRPIIAGAAVLVMFSTTLTVMDGFPRALSALIHNLREEGEPTLSGDGRRDPIYVASSATLVIGAVVVLQFLTGSLRGMVDLATTLSFLTAPALATLNHLAVVGDEVSEDSRPPGWLLTFSLLAIVAQAAFALYYLSVRFG